LARNAGAFALEGKSETALELLVKCSRVHFIRETADLYREGQTMPDKFWKSTVLMLCLVTVAILGCDSGSTPGPNPPDLKLDPDLGEIKIPDSSPTPQLDPPAAAPKARIAE
jgi:hypothetical protein